MRGKEDIEQCLIPRSTVSITCTQPFCVQQMLKQFYTKEKQHTTSSTYSCYYLHTLLNYFTP